MVTAALKVPRTGSKSPVAPTYQCSVVLSGGLPSSSHTCCEQKFSPAPASTSNKMVYSLSVMGCSICGTKGMVFTVFNELTSGSLV